MACKDGILNNFLTYFSISSNYKIHVSMYVSDDNKTYYFLEHNYVCINIKFKGIAVSPPTVHCNSYN